MVVLAFAGAVWGADPVQPRRPEAERASFRFANPELVAFLRSPDAALLPR
jgi:hypothetical protein